VSLLSGLTDARPWGSIGGYVARFVLVAATYYLTARLSLRVALVGSVVTPIWPPTGIAVVALLFFGVRLWPAITLAALLVNVPINSSLGGAALIAVGNTAAPLLAVGLLRAAGFRSQLDRLRDALALVLLGALASMAVSAVLGTAALLIDGTISRGDVASTWALWWAGDATGVLVFAPLLLCVGQVGQLAGRRWLEAAGVMTSLALVAYLVFHSRYQYTYLVFPLLIWAAVRFGQLGASLAAVTVVGMAVWSAIDETGPFAHTTLLHRMLTLQTYDAVTALTSFVLAAIMTDRVAVLQRERRNAETLQRSLLPDRLPTIPGVEFASRYLPGGAGLEVGGDWYDVFALPRGRLGLTIGDVVGRGLGAAAAMGQLRTALRAYAIETDSPAAVLQRLSRLVGEFEGAQMATLVYAVLDPDTGALAFASAGHPPPLLIPPDGAASYLMDGRSPPLGVTKAAQEEAVLTIRPGSTLVLYTDGLIEGRRGSLADSMEALRTAVEGQHGDLDFLVDNRVLQPPRPESSGDDVALLLVRLLPAPIGDLRLLLPAEPHVVASVRRTIRQWATRSGASDEEAYDLVLAVGEAVTNVIEHAYTSSGGQVEVEAAISQGLARIVVRDLGRWRPPRSSEGGRGLLLMQGLVDNVDVVSGPGGTEVRLSRRIGQMPVSVEPVDAPAPMLAPDSHLHVAVTKLIDDIDLGNAARLYHEILDAVSRGAIGLVVDLSAVRHIDSAGMRMLHKLAGWLTQRRLELRVVVPDASSLRRVLELSSFEVHVPVTSTVESAVSEITQANGGFSPFDLEAEGRVGSGCGASGLGSLEGPESQRQDWHEPEGSLDY
jgi:anti-anti-sigma factor